MALVPGPFYRGRVETPSADPGRGTVHFRRRATIWFIFDVVVWCAAIAVSLWKAVPWEDGSAFMICIGLWALFRLGASIALQRVDRFSVASMDRNEVIAGWIFMLRPVANGAFFASLGALVLFQSGRLAVIVGAVLLTVGLGSLAVGLHMIRKWRLLRVTALRMG